MLQGVEGTRSAEDVTTASNVVAFGATSFFNDTASEMAYWILPAFLTSIGAGPAALGLIEGIAESVTSFAKLGSGYWSDKVERRKSIVVAGYVVANAVKPLLALVGAWWQVLLIRFADRFAKGVRGAPRDAMVAESTPAGKTGAAFGLLQAMDSAGAIAGPLLALAIMPHFGFRGVFVAAAVPGALAVFAVTVFVRERRGARPLAGHGAAKAESLGENARQSEIVAGPGGDSEVAASGSGGDQRGFGVSFYAVMFAVGLFSIGNSSDMFLVLRAQNIGIPVTQVPLLGLVFNLTYTLFSWPAGRLSDVISSHSQGRAHSRWRSRRAVAAAGYLVFAATYAVFGLAPSRAAIWGMMALYGLYYALTVPVLKAMVADAAPSSMRGRAFGMLSFVTSAATLLASVLTGELWKHLGAALPFYLSAALAVVAASVLMASAPEVSYRSTLQRS